MSPYQVSYLSGDGRERVQPFGHFREQKMTQMQSLSKSLGQGEFSSFSDASSVREFVSGMFYSQRRIRRNERV
jgi:hypothetical protein